MFNQYAKWLKLCNHIPWRRHIGSLNYLLSSHVWRQDPNGFSHQDPGLIDHVVNKKAEVVRVYLPPDANCLLSVTDHCLRSRNYINVVVAGKQPAPQWLTMDEAIKHCTAGLGIWDWASNDRGQDPDVVMVCCGDVPTLETLAAVDLLRHYAPDLKVRVINVVNLMKLQPSREHPHGLSDHDFDALFTTDKPIVFAFHGYPWLIHRLTYRRAGHRNLHVRGYKEEGPTSYRSSLNSTVADRFSSRERTTRFMSATSSSTMLWMLRRSVTANILKPLRIRCVMSFRNDGFERKRPTIAKTPSAFTIFRWSSSSVGRWLTTSRTFFLMTSPKVSSRNRGSIGTSYWTRNPTLD